MLSAVESITITFFAIFLILLFALPEPRPSEQEAYMSIPLTLEPGVELAPTFHPQIHRPRFIPPSPINGPRSIPGSSSIHQLARKLPRDRIMVPPLQWNSKHLQLLGCNFIESEPSAEAPMRDKYRCNILEQNMLLLYLHMEDKALAILSLMSTPDAPLVDFPDLNFYLGGYPKLKLSCFCFFLRSELQKHTGCFYDESLPVAALVDETQIAYIRNYHRIGGKIKSCEKRRRKTAPQNPLHEPYIVASLISLAQWQWGLLSEESKLCSSGVEAKVLYTRESSSFVYLYKARISSALVSMFGHANNVPDTPQPFDIRIIAIPFLPVETLRNRIMAALVPERFDSGYFASMSATRYI